MQRAVSKAESSITRLARAEGQFYNAESSIVRLIRVEGQFLLD